MIPEDDFLKLSEAFDERRGLREPVDKDRAAALKQMEMIAAHLAADRTATPLDFTARVMGRIRREERRRDCITALQIAAVTLATTIVAVCLAVRPFQEWAARFRLFAAREMLHLPQAAGLLETLNALVHGFAALWQALSPAQTLALKWLPLLLLPFLLVPLAALTARRAFFRPFAH